MSSLDITNQFRHAAQPDSVTSDISHIRQFVTDRLGNIRQLLYTDVQRAKEEIAKHLKSIEMVPQVEGKEGHGSSPLMGAKTASD